MIILEFTAEITPITQIPIIGMASFFLSTERTNLFHRLPNDETAQEALDIAYLPIHLTQLVLFLTITSHSMYECLLGSKLFLAPIGDNPQVCIYC